VKGTLAEVPKIGNNFFEKNFFPTAGQTLMARFSLTAEEIIEIKAFLQQTDDFYMERRAQALLQLHDGHSIERVAYLSGVNRRTVYNWKQRFLKNRSLSLSERLADKPRSGRPRKSLSKTTKFIAQELYEFLDYSMQHYPIEGEIFARDLVKKINEYIELEKKPPRED